MEGITDEFKTLATSVQDLKGQLKDAPDDVKLQFHDFLQVVRSDLPLKFLPCNFVPLKR